MKIAVVGATGLVGLEILKILKERLNINSEDVLKFASRRRPELGILSLSEDRNLLSQATYIFNATDSIVAKDLLNNLEGQQYLIDNSSGLRMRKEVPLIVPEVNADASLDSRVFANPNCTAAMLCMALAPLKKYEMKRVVVSTYQSASGAGIKGLVELEEQELRDYELPLPKAPVFGFPLMGNIMSHNSDLNLEPTEATFAYNDEEIKVMEETRKILDLPDLQLSCTCMRVPVRRSHLETVSVDFAKDFNLDDIRKNYEAFDGVRLVDDQKNNHFPMPLEAQLQDDVLVGRLRKDSQLPKTLHLILAGDQLRKGAATNAVQILQSHLARNK